MSGHDWSRPAVVTGAGSGIGRASVLAFARRGSPVVVADLDPSRVEAVVAEAAALGVEAIGVAGDVGSAEGVAALHATSVGHFGAVGLVMSNVGILASGRPEAIPIESWERLIEVNLLAAVRIQHAFLPAMIERGSGYLVFTASTNALYPYSWDRTPYTATKAAVIALAESLAMYGRPRGVGVSCLCPGPVMTNIVEQMRFYGEPVPMVPPTLRLLDPDEVGAIVVDGVDAGRFLLLTHPEVHDILVRRAEDPEAFLWDQIAGLPAP